jgi:alkyl hydroperoxide reductase subunit AhpC
MPSYEDDLDEFEGLNTQVLGISVDSTPSHEAWEKSIGGITYPLCSDFYPHGEVSQKYGVLRDQGMSERALFIIDKQGIVQFIDVHPIEKQPENAELFDVLRKIENK